MFLDGEKLDQGIKDIEEVLKKYNINERQILLNIVQARILALLQKQQMADMTASVPLGGLIKRIMHRDEPEA